MKQSTISAQVATNLLNLLQGYTKGIRFLLVMFLTLTVSATAWADYTITFKTGSGSEVTTKTAIINSGGDYVSSVSASKTYADSDGLRYGSSDKMGYTTFTLSDAGQIKASKIIFQGAKYYSTDNSSLQYTITYTDATTTSGTIGLTSTATDKEATLESSKTISKIDIRKTTTSKKRFYVQGVKVVSAAVANYTVTFDAGSGSCSTPNFTQTSTTRSIDLPTATTTCEGWTFAGWCISSAGNEDENSTSPGTILLPGDPYTPSSNHTLYAIYTRSEDGASATITESYGFENSDDETKWTINGPVQNNSYKKTGSYAGKINSNNTYITYNEKVNVTSFSFQFMRESTNNNYNVYIETSPDNQTWTAVETYAMSSFSTSKTWYPKSHTFDGKKALYVRFRCYNTTAVRWVDDVSITYVGGATTYYMTDLTCATETAITLYANDGTNQKTDITTGEKTYTVPPCSFSRTGYNFVKWNTKADGTGMDYNPDATINLNGTAVNLYAIWTPIKYTITYELDGGTNHASNPANYTIETEAITLQNPSKQGCDFVGWYKESTFATQVTQIAKGSTGNITLYAKWEVAKTATSLTWSADSYSATIDADNTFPKLTKTPADLSPIAYSSSNTGVATIDENGNITLVAAGTTTIKATFTETNTHAGSTASYTLTVNPSNCRWVEVTDNTTLEDGDEVVITMTWGKTTWALPNNGGTTTPVANVVDNVEGAKMISANDNFIWTIDESDGKYIFYPKGSNTTWLYCIDSNEGVRIGKGDNKYFTVVNGIDSDSENYFLYHNATLRYVGVYHPIEGIPSWRCYTLTDKGAFPTNIKAQTLKFYKRECLDASKVWVEGNLTNVTCDTQLPQQLAKNGSIELTFTAADGYVLPNDVTVSYATKTWNKEDGTLTISNPTNNVTVTVEAVKLHTITWMVGGSELTTGSQTTSVENGKKITAIPADPNDNTLEDCGATTFMGWSETNIGSTPDDANLPTIYTSLSEIQTAYPSITGDKIFYAVFATAKTDEGEDDVTTTFDFTSGYENGTAIGTITQDGVTITFGKGNNNSNKPTYYDSGNAVRVYAKNTITVACTGLTKITFTFGSDGDSNAITANTGSFSTPTWTGSANSVKFTIGGSSGNRRIQKVAVTYTATTSVTTYSNYVTNCCNTPAPTNGTYTSVSGTEIKLTWEDAANTNSYHITGGNLSAEGVYPINDKYYNVTGLKECEEYTFYVSAYPEDGCESEAITITAQPFSGAKTVTFNYNGNGQANTTSSTSCGNTFITLPTPAWTGYRFMGWFNAASDGTKIGEAGASYTPTSDITLYAQWKKEYNVTYNANGGSTTCAGGAYIAGETVTICTTNPTKTGYTFAGWTYSPEVTITDGKFTMPASDVTITAQWTINQYTVTWEPNGGNWAGSTENIVHTYDYGATINRPADPTRDEYRFIGWNTTVASTMPATNITYTAQWKQNYTITFHDGDDTTPWTQTIDAESIDLNTYVGTHACGEYNFAGWSTDATQYNDQTANITTWVTGTYTPTANIHLYAVYVKGDLATDFTLNCDGGVYEIWEKGHNQHMAGRQNGGGYGFQTTEYWDANNSESNGAPFTITKVADNTYTLQNADGQYITGNTYDEDDLDIEDTWENADKYKWTISNGTNGTWRFTNKVSTNYALVFYNIYFQLKKVSNVTSGSSYYDLELTPAASNVYKSNPNCGPYTITFKTGGGEFVQGNYKYSTAVTSNLTETTTTRFPAAELEGYTFAGWKDGSPQEDINYEPYLKKADDNLVVSSNKTYHAVYYYYDEEEDIDWSKEFTTGMYAEADGLKYFVSGTPHDRYGQFAATTECGDVSEVTITPGTGANAGKYKININGYFIKPANSTDLIQGDCWWTITEVSDQPGKYMISETDKKNIMLRNTSFGYYTETVAGANPGYGVGYYYPSFGKCLEHHWTSNPSPKPSITISGDVYVTATNGRGIMATQLLSVAANNLYAGESLTLSSESSDIYFSAERNVNFVKADKPTASLTLTADATGKLEDEVYIHYKPSTDGDGVPFDVIVTAKPTASSVSKDHTIHVRNLPAQFVIATKVGSHWYALPADMNSATNPEGVLIKVDETNMTAKAPTTTVYTLWPVKTTATENDRYTNATGNAYGDRVRFGAVNYEQRGLWANNNKDDNTIRNYAVIDALGDDGIEAYEWKVTTTIANGHWQYTLQTDQENNQKYLRYWTAASGSPKWGTYASGNNQLYFLPVIPYIELDLEVMEWGTSSMVLRIEKDAPTKVNITYKSITYGGKPVSQINNSDLYLIEYNLLGDDCGIMEIDNGSNKCKIIRTPILVSGEKSGSAYTNSLGRDICADCDIIILNGGKLTADEAKSTGSHVDFANIYVYPGGKLVLDGNSLGVKQQVYLRGGYSWLNQSTYALPEVYLNGDINFNGSGNIIYDYYIQNYKYYQFALPYNVQLATVTDEAGIDNFPVWVKHYNGALRAADPHATSWEWYPSENGDANAYFKAGEGYIIAAKPRQVGNVANRPLSIIRFPLSNDAFTGGEGNKSFDTKAHGIEGYKAGTITANNVGWNFVGNPFLSTWQGDIGHKQLSKYPNEANWDGTYYWVEAPTKYITIMSPEDGTDYDQHIAANTKLKPFFPFYLQETANGGSGTLNFAAANRKMNAPALWNVEQEEREAYIQIEIATDAVADQTGVFVGNKYSDDLDFDDYEKMFGTSTDLPKLWIMHDDKRMAFEAMSELKASNATPLGYRAPQEGKYLFDINLDASQLNEVEAIYLTDNETGVTFDLMMGAYEFESSAITYNDTRFLLRIVMKNEDVNEETGIEDIYFNRQQTMKFIHNGIMYIWHDGAIYDATGKQINSLVK